MKKFLLSTASAAILTAGFAGAAVARDQIQIAGSSTVLPYASIVAEAFGENTNFPTPVVESGGSGAGRKKLCEGVGENTIDIANSSSRIKQSDIDLCAQNGVKDIQEVRIGYDGIVFASDIGGAEFAFTPADWHKALAAKVAVDGKLVDNPYKKWSDIDPALPDEAIEVLGPPPTSGTRDAFVELAMEAGAEEFAELKALSKEDGKKFKAIAHGIREDGAFVEAGENDNLIVQKLEANPHAVGIFGFSFLDQNGDKVKGATIGGIAPEFENIAAGDYAISRSLYFYVKRAHIGTIPGIKEFVTEFTSERAWGDDGYLVDKGLIPLTRQERDEVAKSAGELAPLSM